MQPIRPVLKKILIVTIALYVVGTAIFLSQLTHRIGQIEHTLDHLSGAH